MPMDREPEVYEFIIRGKPQPGGSKKAFPIPNTRR